MNDSNAAGPVLPGNRPDTPVGNGNAGGTVNTPVQKVITIADDLFWLKYAKDSIEASKKACDDAAQTLLKVIAWAWPIYTTAFASTSIFFQPKTPPGIRVLLALPILFLFVAYWLATYSLLPVFTKFDPRIPFEIRREYNYVLARRKNRLNWATSVCFVAVLSLSIGLFFIRITASDVKTNPGSAPNIPAAKP